MWIIIIGGVGMYEYKFIKIDLAWGFGEKRTKDYHEVITREAEEGWRLVQIFAPSIYGYGKAKFFELIFEKQI